MARPRTPTEILKLKGSFAKDPKRARGNAPKSKQPLGLAPKYFTDEEKDCWRELQTNAAAGVLTKADRWAVEIAARLMARFRTSDGLSAAEIGSMVRVVSLLGMTPSDRTKIRADPAAQPAKSPWDSLRVIDGGKTKKPPA